MMGPGVGSFFVFVAGMVPYAQSVGLAIFSCSPATRQIECGGVRSMVQTSLRRGAAHVTRPVAGVAALRARQVHWSGISLAALTLIW